MTKDRLVNFGRACASNDARHGRLETQTELREAFSGYAKCLSFFGITTARIHPKSADAAIAVYQDTHGALLIAPAPVRNAVRSQNPPKRRRNGRALLGVAWSGALLRRMRRARAA